MSTPFFTLNLISSLSLEDKKGIVNFTLGTLTPLFDFTFPLLKTLQIKQPSSFLFTSNLTLPSSTRI